LLNNGDIITTDPDIRELIRKHISYNPMNGDPHLALAEYFRNNPELGVTVVRATEQTPYNPNAVY
jgi:hypothetical protein